MLEHKRLTGLPNESGFYHGQIMEWLHQLDPRNILLAGEKQEMGPIVAHWFVGEKIVETAGLVDADHIWDFNDFHPTSLMWQSYDAVVTQSILEHILNPYGFVKQLAEMIRVGGHLIVHTHLPPFPYHRFPIDCLRYFPDWFVAVAERFDLQEPTIKTVEGHIFALYRKGRG